MVKPFLEFSIIHQLKLVVWEPVGVEQKNILKIVID
jgi:hypothetical protein